MVNHVYGGEIWEVVDVELMKGEGSQTAIGRLACDYAKSTYANR